MKIPSGLITQSANHTLSWWEHHFNGQFEKGQYSVEVQLMINGPLQKRTLQRGFAHSFLELCTSEHTSSLGAFWSSGLNKSSREKQVPQLSGPEGDDPEVCQEFIAVFFGVSLALERLKGVFLQYAHKLINIWG